MPGPTLRRQTIPARSRGARPAKDYPRRTLHEFSGRQKQSRRHCISDPPRSSEFGPAVLVVFPRRATVLASKTIEFPQMMLRRETGRLRKNSIRRSSASSFRRGIVIGAIALKAEGDPAEWRPGFALHPFPAGVYLKSASAPAMSINRPRAVEGRLVFLLNNGNNSCRIRFRRKSERRVARIFAERNFVTVGVTPGWRAWARQAKVARSMLELTGEGLFHLMPANPSLPLPRNTRRKNNSS